MGGKRPKSGDVLPESGPDFQHAFSPRCGPLRARMQHLGGRYAFWSLCYARLWHAFGPVLTTITGKKTMAERGAFWGVLLLLL